MQSCGALGIEVLHLWNNFFFAGRKCKYPTDLSEIEWSKLRKLGYNKACVSLEPRKIYSVDWFGVAFLSILKCFALVTSLTHHVAVSWGFYWLRAFCLTALCMVCAHCSLFNSLFTEVGQSIGEPVLATCWLLNAPSRAPSRHVRATLSPRWKRDFAMFCGYPTSILSPA